MESFSISNIKAEKANAIRKYRQLQRIASFFRVLEICLVLAVLSRFSTHLPVAVRNSGEYFKGLTVILASPQFVFVLGNAIVITLFAKSGHFSGHDSTGKNSRTDLYDEFIAKSEKNPGIYKYEADNRGKQTTSVSQKVILKYNSVTPEVKNYQRSLSEKIKRSNSNKCCRELKRSATENLRGRIDCGAKSSYPEDNMSNEEFRCTVEAFIARQKRFRIDEENSVF